MLISDWSSDVRSSDLLNRTTNRCADVSAGGDLIERVGQDRFDGRLSIAVPIASRDENPHSLLGDLALDFAGGLTFGSRQASRPRFEVGANWSPIPALRINGSASFAKLAPSLEQIGRASCRETVCQYV